jgi:hypothetical protein
MTAATTGLAGQQQARPAFPSARQSMAGMAAAGRRSAGSLKAVHCSARSRVMAISLARAASRSPGPLFPGRRAEGPLWNRLTAVPGRRLQLQTRGSDDRGVCFPASRPMSRCRAPMTPRWQPGRGCAAWARRSPASSAGPRWVAIRGPRRIHAGGRGGLEPAQPPSAGERAGGRFRQAGQGAGPPGHRQLRWPWRPGSAPGAGCGTALGIFGRAQFRRAGAGPPNGPRPQDLWPCVQLSRRLRVEIRPQARHACGPASPRGRAARRAGRVRAAEVSAGPNGSVILV